MTRKTKAIPGMNRPMPPEELFAPMGKSYMPALQLPEWVRDNILEEGSALYNEEHAHLIHAPVAFLWAAGGFEKQGRVVLGMCEELTFRCGPWQKGRQEQQMLEWYGLVPDFLITLDAAYCSVCTDVEFCALVEHELYHIGHQRDDFGAPAFKRDGDPKIGMRAHDVEEFVGVVRRYGASEDVAKMVEAASKAPEIAKLNIARACGTCLLKAA